MFGGMALGLKNRVWLVFFDLNAVGVGAELRPHLASLRGASAEPSPSAGADQSAAKRSA